MRKTIATAALAGSLLAGGAIGSALFSAGAATAQSSSSDSSSSSTAPDQGANIPNPSDAPPGPAFDGHGPRRGPGPHGHPDLGVAANAIGVSTDDLLSALRSGQSIADVAKAHNVDPQTVVDALVADAKAKLADRVASGDLTQAQADQMSADLEQRITDLVNHAGGPGGPGGPGGAGCPNMDGSGPGAGAPGGSGSSGSTDSSSSAPSASDS